MRDVLDDARRLVDSGQRVAVAMVVDSKRSAPRPLGSRLLVTESGEMVGSVSGGCVESDVVLRAQEVLASGEPRLVPYGISDDDAFDVGLPCGGEIKIFIQVLDPEEVSRIEAAVRDNERLSVATTLGSRRAQEKRRTRLLNAGYSESEIDRISGPLGLDIGAVTPAETAVSILAEVLAVRSHRDGGRLAGSGGRIHPETVTSPR